MPSPLSRAAFFISLWLWPVFSVFGAVDHNYPSVTAWPIATHSADAEGSTTNLAFGLLHHRQKGAYERYALRPGIFNLETNTERDTSELSLAFDLLHVEHRGEESRRHLFPVYWQGKERGKSWFHLWPLYGESIDVDGSQTLSTLYPLFSLTRNPANEDWTLRYLWPLGEIKHAGEEQSSRLLPFYWRSQGPQHSDGMIFPYLWLEHDDSYTRAILPLWWWHRSPERSAGLLFPYAWWEENDVRQDLFFPLWWRSHTPQSRYSLLFPLYFGWENAQSSGSVVLPLWYEAKLQQNRFSILLPLYLDWRVADESRLRLILPFYGDYRSPATATTLLLPFYFRHYNAVFDSTLRYWFPFVGRYERGSETQQYYLFPLYAHMEDRESGYDSSFFLWPLIHHETLPEAHDTWVLPLFRHQQSADRNNSMAALLWWDGKSPERDYTYLLPLYGHWRNSEAEYTATPVTFDLRKADGYRKRFFLGPLAIQSEDPQKELRQLDIFWPLISHRRKGETLHSRFLPLWWHDEEPGRSLSLALIPPYFHKEETGRSLFHLWPFYGRKIEGDFREDAVIWPLFRYGRELNGERRSWQALLAFGSSDTDRKTFGLIPLWYHRRNGEEKVSLSLLHWQESNPDASNFSLLHLGHPGWSLFNVSQSPLQQHYHLYPLYSVTMTTAPETFRAWILWPLYSMKREEGRAQDAFLWKFLYRDSSPQKSESGFLWRIIRFRHDKETSIFEFNPFYYRETKADGSEDYIAWLGGLFATLRTVEKTEHRLFWIFSW